MAIVIPLRIFHSSVEGLVATAWNVIKFHQAVLYLWRNGSHKTRGGGPEVWFNYENVTEAGLKIRRLRWPFNSVAETRFIDILWAPCLACHAFSLPRTSHGRNYADRRNFHPGIVRNSFHSPAILSRREIVVTWQQKLASFDSTVDPFSSIMCAYKSFYDASSSSFYDVPVFQRFPRTIEYRNEQTTNRTRGKYCWPLDWNCRTYLGKKYRRNLLGRVDAQ